MMNCSVSYIVSAYNRPQSLRGTLASLQVQTDPNFEVIVADNNPDIQYCKNMDIVADMQDGRFRWVDTSHVFDVPRDCYWSAEWVVENIAKGDYLVFPSDDSFYVPIFQEAMLARARESRLDLVYCDMLYDRRIGGKYSVLNVQPVSCAIDKTGFMIARTSWIGFPTKPTELRSSCADGEMIAEVVARGARHGKVEEVLVVHN